MPAPTSPQASDDFLSMARRLALLDEPKIDMLKSEALSTSLPAASLAVRHGLLDTVQIDVVETLLHPHDAVPGYEILDLIGQGGMGVVFRARQKSLDRIVAVKTILVSQMNNQTALARFEQEALAVARLRHPNIVAAYDLGRHQGRLFFVMELVEGEDVERFVATRGPVDEATVWGLLRQAAGGLSHAAAAGIVHRDIKPANLLLIEPPAGFEIAHGLKMVKITDFGLAFLTRDVAVKTRLTSDHVTIGSPHYLAPEQLHSETVDHRVDIYALGATACHMLTGAAPFAAKNLTQIIAQKLATDSIDVRTMRPDISQASADLVLRMTQRDPAQRLGSYADLLAQIDALDLAGMSRPGRPVRNAATTTIAIGSDLTPAPTVKPAVVPAAAGSHRGTIERGAPTVAAVLSVERSSRRRFVLICGAGAAGAVATGMAAWSLFGKKGGKSKRTLFPAGLEANLFDGVSLTGWQPRQGSWSVAKNSEGGRVISGADGTMIRPLYKTVAKSRRSLTHYRVTVVMQCHQATAAEIEFGIEMSGDTAGDRYVVRATKEGIRLGSRPSDGADFRSLSEPHRFPSGPSDPFILFIERQPQSWEAFLDESSLGSVPIHPGPEAAEFHLRVEGSEAWFSDMSVQELAAAQPAANDS